MRKLYSNKPRKDEVAKIAKRMSIEHNVTLRVLDEKTGEVLQTSEGHNAATNSMLTGIAHYLIGDGVYNQAYSMLSDYLPRYMSLGTMGLISQDDDDRERIVDSSGNDIKNDNYGLPIGIGGYEDDLSVDETTRLCHYMAETPGFGADGYEITENNNRVYMGLGPMYKDRNTVERSFGDDACYCELISKSFPRIPIAYREIVPEYDAETAKTIDIVYSGMVSTGALSSFRGGDDHIFVCEAGLWSKKTYVDSGDNGLLAGYRIMPPDRGKWNLGTFVPADNGLPERYVLANDDILTKNMSEPEREAANQLAAQQLANQHSLKKNILRVGKNQVVQIIWKIQLGALEQLGDLSELYPNIDSILYWTQWDKVTD